MERFLNTLMKTTGFPEESFPVFLNAYRTLSACPAALEKTKLLAARYLSPEDADFQTELHGIADEISVPPLTVDLLFLMLCAEPLLENYRRAGISEERFWNLMIDLRCKVIECRKMYGVYGTSTFNWFRWHYQMKRFALGRFQYEAAELRTESPITVGGVLLEPHRTVYNFHIPSTGESLSRDVRYESYRLAKEFFCKNGEDYAVLTCQSWLLYPGYRNVFPEKSHLREFTNDFTIIKSFENERFDDAWRVFYKSYRGSTEGFPAETTLQKNLIRYINEGNTFGSGYGVIVFDGTAIL